MISGNEHVLLRTFNHWCKTQELDSDSSQVKTSAGPSCFGPGLSPLGFNISAQYPASTQIDPFVASPSTIASVRAVHYTTTLAGEQIVDGVPCYRLVLAPTGSPNYYPLRGLLVDEQTFDVRGLTYAMTQNGWAGSIDYAFRPYTARGIWWIASISARWTPPPRDRTDLPFASLLTVTGVTFPTL